MPRAHRTLSHASPRRGGQPCPRLGVPTLRPGPATDPNGQSVSALDVPVRIDWSSSGGGAVAEPADTADGEQIVVAPLPGVRKPPHPPHISPGSACWSCICLPLHVSVMSASLHPKVPLGVARAPRRTRRPREQLAEAPSVSRSPGYTAPSDPVGAEGLARVAGRRRVPPEAVVRRPGGDSRDEPDEPVQPPLRREGVIRSELRVFQDLLRRKVPPRFRSWMPHP